MSGEALTFALTAGSLAAVNPCGFAMLPAYLSLFVLPSEGSTLRALGRALVATLAMTIGFVAVFGAFGLALTPIASSVQRWAPVVSIVIGVGLVAFGLFLLAGRSLSLRVPFLKLGRDPVSSPVAMVLYGISYAVASLGCTVGPFLVVTATTFRSGDTATGLASYTAYAVGMGLVVGVLAVSAAVVGQGAAQHLRRLMPLLARLSGVLLIVGGAYVGWYGWYELRVYAGRSTDDPIIGSASHLQTRLADGVDAIGPGGFAAIFGILVLLTVLRSRVGRRRTGTG